MTEEYIDEFYRTLEQTETALTENNAIHDGITFLYEHKEHLRTETYNQLEAVAEDFTEFTVKVMELLEQFRADSRAEFKKAVKEDKEQIITAET